jgi:hypothetical protein
MSTASTPIDYLTAELWECDGCGYVDRLQAVNAHINHSCYWPDGTFKDDADVVCWGALLIGGAAWCAWHFEDIHPMNGLSAIINDTIVRQDMDLYLDPPCHDEDEP